MKKQWAKGLFLALGIVLLLNFPVLTQEAADAPKAELPVLITSAGQSPDVMTVNIVCEEAGIKYDYCDVPDAALLDSGVGLADKKAGPGFHVEIHSDLEKFPKGTPYKTVIFAIGASLKGMGASGLTVETEVKRLKEVIERCKKKEIFVIAVHAGGISKRGAPGSDNERMIDTVAPFADYLIVTKDSNQDGRFDTIAKDKGIPLTQIEYALELVEIFNKIFKPE